MQPETFRDTVRALAAEIHKVIVGHDVIDTDAVAGVEEAARDVAGGGDEQRALAASVRRAVPRPEPPHTQEVAQHAHIDVEHAVVALAERLGRR